MYNVFWHLTDNIKFIVSWVSVLCRVEKLKNVSTFWGVTEVWNLPFSLFFCTTPQISCFPPPALQVPLSGVVKKSCVFPKKNLGKILSVRGIVVPLHSLSEKIRGQGFGRVSSGSAWRSGLWHTANSNKAAVARSPRGAWVTAKKQDTSISFTTEYNGFR